MSALGANTNGKAPIALLIVDDDPSVIESLSALLRKLPYHVATANSMSEALQAIDDFDFDLVVVDQWMPGGSGNDLLREVRARRPSIARILMTGDPTLEMAVAAINESSVSAFLEKPFSREQFLEKIEEVLAKNDEPRSGEQSANLEEAEKLLSPREFDVFSRLVLGERIPAVARALFVSPYTVRNHLKAIFRKLDLHSQSELAERYGNRRRAPARR